MAAPPPSEIGPKLSDTFRLGIEPNTASSTAEGSETFPTVINLAENVPKQVGRVCRREPPQGTRGACVEGLGERDQDPLGQPFRATWRLLGHPAKVYIYVDHPRNPGMSCPAGTRPCHPPFAPMLPKFHPPSQVWQLERRRGQLAGQDTSQVPPSQVNPERSVCKIMPLYCCFDGRGAPPKRSWDYKRPPGRLARYLKITETSSTSCHGADPREMIGSVGDLASTFPPPQFGAVVSLARPRHGHPQARRPCRGAWAARGS